MIALYDCEADEEDELTFQRGAIVTLSQFDEELEWWEGVLASGESGLFPKSYVRDLNEDEKLLFRVPTGSTAASAQRNNTATTATANKNQDSASTDAPVPPPLSSLPGLRSAQQQQQLAPEHLYESLTEISRPSSSSSSSSASKDKPKPVPARKAPPPPLSSCSSSGKFFEEKPASPGGSSQQRRKFSAAVQHHLQATQQDTAPELPAPRAKRDSVDSLVSSTAAVAFFYLCCCGCCCCSSSSCCCCCHRRCLSPSFLLFTHVCLVVVLVRVCFICLLVVVWSCVCRVQTSSGDGRLLRESR